MKVIILALILSAGSAVAAEDLSTSAGRGHPFVKNHCASCHSVEKEGSSPNTKSPPLRDLHRKYPIENLRESFAEGMETGHNDMPDLELKGGEIDDVIAYIESLSAK